MITYWIKNPQDVVAEYGSGMVWALRCNAGKAAEEGMGEECNLVLLNGSYYSTGYMDADPLADGYRKSETLNGVDPNVILTLGMGIAKFLAVPIENEA